MILAVIIILPLFAGLLSLCLRGRLLWWGNCLAHAIVAALSVALAYHLSSGYVLSCGQLLRADALSAFFVLLIGLVNFASIIYSRGYFSEGSEEGALSARQERLYYMLCNLFSCAMLFAALVDNLGHMWVAIEMTTLASAFLVGFYRTKTSVEAAWKYVIICSVGITLALLGTVLLYYNVALNTNIKSLDWSQIMAVSSSLDHRPLAVALLFILIGYGTKAGLVPMHTWLPDAHSQALTPISALLSGVLLKTSLYAIIRFGIIANSVLGKDFFSYLLLWAGLLSVIVASIFMLVQKDIKRLFAYSSIEHIGIITFGLGIGTPLAVFGAFFHALNHAFGKSLMFFAAGIIVKKYKTHNMHQIQGVIQSLPYTGIFLLVGLFAMVGMPPFAIFMSKLMILTAAFGQGMYIQGAILLVFLGIVFCSFLLHISKVIFGRKPKALPSGAESLSVKLIFSGLTIFMVALGIVMPVHLGKFIAAAVKIVTGV